MLLSALLRAVPGAQITGNNTLEVDDLAYDSREVRPGSLFVAVPSVGAGPRSGGVQFVSSALQRGAVAVVTETEIDLPAVTCIRVPDARKALADLAAAFFEHPSQRLHAFAVTGTDGKTTTTYLLDAVFGAAGYRTGLLGTIETKIGEQRTANTDRVTTPESLDLQRVLRAMVQANVTHVSLEASSHALALDRLRGCRFEACALTNVTGDHVEFHGSWDAYLAAKTLLFTEVAPQAPAVLNRDDPNYDHFAQRAAGRVISYSKEVGADVMACDVAPSPDGFQFQLLIDGRRAPVTLRLPGRFNVSNALAAAGLAFAGGLSVADIAAGLSAATAPPGRMQLVQCGQPFEVIVDYGHTPYAFRSVLSTLRQTCAGRLIAVFGATGNRDRAKRPVLAGIAREFADFFIITNEDPFGEDVEAIMAEVAAGVPEAEEGERYVRQPDRAEAIRMALSRAEAGDTVVILGKGHETSIVAHGEKQPWSDVGTVRTLLEGHA